MQAHTIINFLFHNTNNAIACFLTYFANCFSWSGSQWLILGTLCVEKKYIAGHHDAGLLELWDRNATCCAIKPPVKKNHSQWKDTLVTTHTKKSNCCDQFSPSLLWNMNLFTCAIKMQIKWINIRVEMCLFWEGSRVNYKMYSIYIYTIIIIKILWV